MKKILKWLDKHTLLETGNWPVGIVLTITFFVYNVISLFMISDKEAFSAIKFDWTLVPLYFMAVFLLSCLLLIVATVESLASIILINIALIATGFASFIPDSIIYIAKKFLYKKKYEYCISLTFLGLFMWLNDPVKPE